MVELFANSGDPGQTSDLGQQCMPSTLLWVSRLQWVNRNNLGSVSLPSRKKGICPRMMTFGFHQVKETAKSHHTNSDGLDKAVQIRMLMWEIYVQLICVIQPVLMKRKIESMLMTAQSITDLWLLMLCLLVKHLSRRHFEMIIFFSLSLLQKVGFAIRDDLHENLFSVKNKKKRAIKNI